MRCVRHLSKYFPTDPKGLCNILHQKATGAPPGHGPIEVAMKGGHHSIAWSSEDGLVAATKLLATQPKLGKDLWAGPLAPINRPTGEPRRIRVFEPNSIKHRDLPLPLKYQQSSADGHQGGVTVGRIMGAHVGPDQNGQDWLWGWGDWLDPSMVPEVNQAKYMVDQGIVGPSLDPGGQVRGVINPETGAEHTTQYTMGGATLVQIPAFANMRIYNLTPEGDWPNAEDPDMAMENTEGPDCGCGQQPAVAASVADVYVVNGTGWQSLPLAPRDAVFDNDNAIQRIQAWANGDPAKMNQAFMWRNPQGSTTDLTSYRMPVGDIINGKLTIIYHAIYAAAALLSGAHGGLPDIPDPDKNQLRHVITNIYQEMAKSYNDSTLRAPWDRPATAGGQFAVTNPKQPYGDVKYADPGFQQDGKKRYPIDTEEHVRAAWAYINQADNAGQYKPFQLKIIRARIVAAAKKLGINIADNAMGAKPSQAEYAMADSKYPLDPPLSWFSNPRLTAKTPLTVTEDGQVYGHLAAWGECHRDVGMRECVLAPKSHQEYAPFHLGQVATAEGEVIRAGKIVMDTRHADISLGYASAALHYDNTGDEAAVVRAGEDAYGIWVAGAVVPEATQNTVAKLRRSPLSGDWRRVDGHLELIAALAVNVPAFPVYAMDGEEQTALCAAGTVDPTPNVGQPVSTPPTGIIPELNSIVAAVREQLAAEQRQEELAWRLRELVDEDDTEAQDARISRLAEIYAADSE